MGRPASISCPRPASPTRAFLWRARLRSGRQNDLTKPHPRFPRSLRSGGHAAHPPLPSPTGRGKGRVAEGQEGLGEVNDKASGISTGLVLLCPDQGDALILVRLLFFFSLRWVGAAPIV